MLFSRGWAPPTCYSLGPVDNLKKRFDSYRNILYISNMSQKVDKYKNAEWVTIGAGPVRIQIIKASNLNMGLMFYLTKKLFEIETELKTPEVK